MGYGETYDSTSRTRCWWGCAPRFVPVMDDRTHQGRSHATAGYTRPGYPPMEHPGVLSTRSCLVLFVAWIALVLPQPAAAAARCDALAGLKLHAGTVTAAERVAAKVFVPPGPPGSVPAQALYRRLPEFCRVQLTLVPTAKSNIKVEVWLPLTAWNGRFQAVGNGGFAGTVPYTAMARALFD